MEMSWITAISLFHSGQGIDLFEDVTAGNHVTTSDSLHIKIKTNDVINFDFFANSAKIKVVMALKCSGLCGESYFGRFLAIFNDS